MSYVNIPLSFYSYVNFLSDHLIRVFTLSDLLSLYIVNRHILLLGKPQITA